jgi:hypothetical protein
VIHDRFTERENGVYTVAKIAEYVVEQISPLRNPTSPRATTSGARSSLSSLGRGVTDEACVGGKFLPAPSITS